MAVALENRRQAEPSPTEKEVPPLESGDRLTAQEFLRRYEAMPHVKKAELIEGIVYMGSPVRYKQHGEPDFIAHTWLGAYAAQTPGTEGATNTTAKLDIDNVPQPDVLLRILPKCGGRSRIDDEGYLVGPPELALEICASSQSIDLRDKLIAYRRAGVQEYLVWCTVEKNFTWLLLGKDDYHPNSPDSKGIIRSQVFPGLWLDMQSLLALDAAKVLQSLQLGLNCPEHKAFLAQLTAAGKP
jgi:Uma2 family endonuclease